MILDLVGNNATQIQAEIITNESGSRAQSPYPAIETD